MTALSYTEAFRSYGAALVNPQWAYSAIANDGSLVMSCWAHKLRLNGGVLVYADRLSRWRLNTPGKNLLIQHISEARDNSLPIRLVVATTDRPEIVDRGDDASSIRKTFHVKPDVVGRVTEFDGDKYVLEFRRA